MSMSRAERQFGNFGERLTPKFVMRFCAETVAPLLVVLTLFFSSTECRRRVRIIGGSEAKEHEFPSVIYASNGVGGFGGTLISYRTVLTAAHNLQAADDPDIMKKFVIYIGIHDRTKDYDDKHKYKIAGFKRFKDTNQKVDPPEDIALIYLDRPVDMTALGDSAHFAEFTSLPASDLNNCVIVGWGVTTANGNTASLTPRKAQVTLIKSQKTCGKMVYDETDSRDSGIPAQDYGYDKGSLCFWKGNGNHCEGDSGGPVFCKDPDNFLVQAGVISSTFSYGDNCGHQLSVASSVIEHRRWISKNVKH